MWKMRPSEGRGVCWLWLWEVPQSEDGFLGGGGDPGGQVLPPSMLENQGQGIAQASDPSCQSWHLPTLHSFPHFSPQLFTAAPQGPGPSRGSASPLIILFVLFLLIRLLLVRAAHPPAPDALTAPTFVQPQLSSPWAAAPPTTPPPLLVLPWPHPAPTPTPAAGARAPWGLSC